MKNKYYIFAKKVFTENVIKENTYVLIEDDLISEITTKPQENIQIIKTDLSLVPGFLDLHIHGREGCDIMDANPKSIEIISKSLVKHGVVGFLATTVTSTWENTLEAYSVIGEAYQNQPSGAEVLGAYNEGLFFSEKYKGAHDDSYFKPLNIENIKSILEASNNSLKVFALAPELDNSAEVIKFLTQKGIKVMLGHTNANYDETCKALELGASGGVHVFNAMTGIHHRKPGCAGAVLLDENAYVEVIADNVHLHPAILEMITKLKQTDKIGLISDCIVAGGLKDGNYKLGMLDVSVEKGIARTNSGSLAGSTLTLEKAVLNMITKGKVSPVNAVNMASLSPAKFLGIDSSQGSIAVGKKANFSLADDKFNIQKTYINGKLVFSN